MPQPVPLIYTGPASVRNVDLGWRISLFLISLACLGALVIAARLTPDPNGYGTHTQLGLNDCQFMARTGLPCPSCGMTSSFAWFVRGNVLASLYVQPMGTVLALSAALMFWAGVYIAVTGKPVARLMRTIPARYYVVPLLAWALIAWGWKIYIHVRGIDGWK